jgi:hypothetical protein
MLGRTVEFTSIGSMHPESHSAYLLSGGLQGYNGEVYPLVCDANPFMEEQ